GAKVGHMMYSNLHQLLDINFSAPNPWLQVQLVLSMSGSLVWQCSRWLQPHPGERVGSDSSGNILRHSGSQQSVDSDGMCTGSSDTASGGLQAAPRALLGSTPPSRLM
ncbi:hypothetical protein POSPLADRAFT_1160078, partial [Postia placenta MAD-698-R-SB12]